MTGIRASEAELAAGMLLLERAFEEDLGPTRLDLTTCVTFGHEARAEIVARQAGVICGVELVTAAFEMHGVDDAEPCVVDGDVVEAGTVLARVDGSADALLLVERTALNIVQRLSGTATMTRAFVDAVEGTGAVILDTRKTMPGMRALQRWAVRCGGGHNHRFGLFDEAMLKDNHIAVAGGIASAVQVVRDSHPGCRLHVETTTLEQVREALASGADVIMLDNMSTSQMRDAVALVGAQALTEASGGITLATARSVAETGVDRISVGALTHSAPALDVALDVR